MNPKRLVLSQMRQRYSVWTFARDLPMAAPAHAEISSNLPYPIAAHMQEKKGRM